MSSRALVMATLAMLALTHTVQPWQLSVGSFLIETIAAFLPASTSMLPRIVASSAEVITGTLDQQ